MNRYRIAYRDVAGNGHFQDVESNSLAHAIWELAKELGSGTLIDTMSLPSNDTYHRDPVHVNLYPTHTPPED